MYKIAICDDDDSYVQYLKRMLALTKLDCSKVEFYEYNSGEELLADVNMVIEYDVLFLDIQMGGIDGNETARRYRDKYVNTILIFCSGVYQPTVKVFRVFPYRYILKQYTDKKIIKELNEIADAVIARKQEPYIIGNNHYSIVKLKPEEIMYISIAKRGSNIFVYPHHIKYEFERNITSKEKVEDLYNILEAYNFVYVHNSYIVNLRYIKRKTLTEIELIEGTVLSIARSKEKSLRESLAEYLAKKY